MNYIKKIKLNFKNDQMLKWYFVLFISSLIGIVTIHVSSFVVELSDQEYAEENPMKVWFFGPIILYFYFTFQSVFLGFLLSIFSIFNIFDKKNIHFQRFKTFVFINLFLTMTLFWSFVFISSKAKYSIFGFINTVILHLIVPIISTGIFIKELKISHDNIKLTNKDWKYFWVYVFAWFMASFFEYFVIGELRKDAAIYPMTDYWNQPIYLTIITFIVVPIFYLLFAKFVIYLQRRHCLCSDCKISISKNKIFKPSIKTKKNIEKEIE